MPRFNNLFGLSKQNYSNSMIPVYVRWNISIKQKLPVSDCVAIWDTAQTRKRNAGDLFTYQFLKQGTGPLVPPKHDQRFVVVVIKLSLRTP